MRWVWVKCDIMEEARTNEMYIYIDLKIAYKWGWYLPLVYVRVGLCEPRGTKAAKDYLVVVKVVVIWILFYINHKIKRN